MEPGVRSESADVGPRIRVRHYTASGGLWFSGWLFTVGFVHLAFGQTVLALIIWPYYLGVHLGRLVR